MKRKKLTSSTITGTTGSGPIGICASASGFGRGDEVVVLTANARVVNAAKALKIIGSF